MPDHQTSYISVPSQIVARDQSPEEVRQIEALETDNFKLRNQITALELHNATLRRMLDLKERKTAGSLRP
jgi:hypothetical protein